MGLMEGRRVVVLGVANERSLAWAIAQKLRAEGAEIALTYPNEAIERRVRPLAEELGVGLVLPCDVQDDRQIAALASRLGEQWGHLDGLVHSIAFARREDLGGRFIDTPRDGFHLALDVSAYSLVALARATEPLLREAGGSVLTLSYLGAERVIPGYNVMGVAKAALEACVRYLAAELGPHGVRVNAISAGPVKTLSSAGIPGFRTMLRHHAERAPLRRNVGAQEIGAAALYLLSELSQGVTGEVLHVDAGYNVMGL